jgi:trk system potassium uptake protein TrkA
MGTPDAMLQVEALVNRSESRGRVRVTIIGGGDVGLQVAERLEQLPSIELRIMERDLARGEMLAARLTRTLVLNGDGTDLEFLESENVGQSDVLVCVIDNDERNLLASLLGRQLGVPKIVTRVSRLTNLRLFERVGIDVALSARGAAVASILHQITGGTSTLLAVLEHGEARVLELTVSKQFTAKLLKGIGTPVDAIVGAILRDGDAIVPRGDDRIEPGDRILVFSTREAADRVQAYFSGAGT